MAQQIFNVAAPVVAFVRANNETDAIAKLTRTLQSVGIEIFNDALEGTDAFVSDDQNVTAINDTPRRGPRLSAVDALLAD